MSVTGERYFENNPRDIRNHYDKLKLFLKIFRDISNCNNWLKLFLKLIQHFIIQFQVYDHRILICPCESQRVILIPCKMLHVLRPIPHQ